MFSVYFNSYKNSSVRFNTAREAVEYAARTVWLGKRKPDDLVAMLESGTKCVGWTYGLNSANVEVVQ